MIVFDLDDTLYPELQFVRGGMLAAGERLDAITGRSTGAGDLFLSIVDQHGIDRVFNRGLDALGIEANDGLIGDLVDSFRGHTPSIRPYSGITGLLDRLADSGVGLGLISDGPLRVQESKWSALGLQVTFDAVVFTDALGGRDRWKPDPLAFREFENRFDLSGAALAMVGDRPERDFPAADALGWHTIRTRFPGAFHENDRDAQSGRLQARSVDELEDLLFHWLTPV